MSVRILCLHAFSIYLNLLKNSAWRWRCSWRTHFNCRIPKHFNSITYKTYWNFTIISVIKSGKPKKTLTDIRSSASGRTSQTGISREGLMSMTHRTCLYWSPVPQPPLRSAGIRLHSLQPPACHWNTSHGTWHSFHCVNGPHWRPPVLPGWTTWVHSDDVCYLSNIDVNIHASIPNVGVRLFVA